MRYFYITFKNDIGQSRDGVFSAICIEEAVPKGEEAKRLYAGRGYDDHQFYEVIEIKKVHFDVLKNYALDIDKDLRMDHVKLRVVK